jgi:hypothetical protein
MLYLNFFAQYENAKMFFELANVLFKVEKNFSSPFCVGIEEWLRLSEYHASLSTRYS